MTRLFGGLVVPAAALVLVGGALWSAHADPTCVLNAKTAFKDCRAQCKSDFVDARFTCKNIDPACGTACLAGRQACFDNVDAILETGKLPDNSDLPNCTGGTNKCMSDFAAAKTACGAPCAPTNQACIGCVDNAQIVNFICRDTCGDSWRTNPTVISMKANCRTVFKACVQACPPAGNGTTTTTTTSSASTTSTT